MGDPRRQSCRGVRKGPPHGHHPSVTTENVAKKVRRLSAAIRPRLDRGAEPARAAAITHYCKISYQKSLSSSIVLEHLPRAVDPRLDRPQGDVEHLGDVLVRELLLVPQNDHDPVVGGEILDRVLESIAIRSFLMSVLSGVSRGDGVLALDFALRALDRFVHGERVDAPFAHRVDTEVRRDLQEPVGESVRGVVAVEHREDFGERFLREVAGFLAVSHHLVADVVDGALVFDEQRAVGPFVTGLRLRDELSIVFSHDDGSVRNERRRPRTAITPN